jgi:hypothetical protein
MTANIIMPLNKRQSGEKKAANLSRDNAAAGKNSRYLTAHITNVFYVASPALDLSNPRSESRYRLRT